MARIRHNGGIESGAQSGSYVDESGAYMDYDAGGGYAQFGAKAAGVGSVGVKIKTILAGVVQTALTFAANASATFAAAVIIAAGGLTISSGTLAAQAITGTTAVFSSTVDASGNTTITKQYGTRAQFAVVDSGGAGFATMQLGSTSAGDNSTYGIVQYDVAALTLKILSAGGASGGIALITNTTAPIILKYNAGNPVTFGSRVYLSGAATGITSGSNAGELIFAYNTAIRAENQAGNAHRHIIGIGSGNVVSIDLSAGGTNFGAGINLGGALGGSLSFSVSVPNNAATTIFDGASVGGGRAAFVIVTSDNGVESALVPVVLDGNGDVSVGNAVVNRGTMAFSVNGTNVRVTHTQGSTQTYSGRVVLLRGYN
jgi:hypothetical protein